mgnify:CR=1 FL=1
MHLKSAILQPLKNSLTSTQYCFSGQTGLTGGVPSTLFHNLTKVVSINNMFEGCTNMEGAFYNLVPVNANGDLAPNTGLLSISGFDFTKCTYEYSGFVLIISSTAKNC